MYSLISRYVLFQSTPPCGRRPAVEFLKTRGYRVSIHASVREATAERRFWEARQARFNPRLRAGGDLSESASPSTAWAVSIHASVREAT